MPIHNYGLRSRHNREDLVRCLAWEIRHQKPMPGQTPDDQPEIYIEEHDVGSGDQYHVHVVWQKWQGVPEMHRSGIILDAFKEARPQAADNIVIAMGLTSSEAAALGLDRDGSQ